MRKRILTLALAAALLLSVFAGCTNGGTSTADSKGATGSAAGGDTGTSQTAAADDNINLDGTMPIIKDPSKFEKMTMAIVVPAERVVASEELIVMKKLAEETGVHFEWQEIPADGSTEKINLMLSSGDLPDCFWNGISSVTAVQYSDQDVFMPTEDLVEKYMPRLKEIFEKRPEYKAGSTAPDGHSYGFPYIEEMNGLVLTPGPFLINQTWLDKVGKKMPTTVDEYVECLKAFRDGGDLNGNGQADEIPYAIGLGCKDGFGSYNTFNTFTAAFGMADSYCNNNYIADHLLVVDGKITFTAMDEAYKKTANFFNMLQKEKLLDPDSFSPGPSEGTPLFINKAKGETAVLGSFGCWAPANEIVNPEVRKEYVALPRLTGEAGKTGVALNFSEMQDTSMVAITTECKNPEVIAAFVDYCMIPENSITLNWGAEGYIYEKGEDGILHFRLDDSNNILLKDGYQTFGEMRNNTTPTRGSLAVLNEYYGKYADYTWDAVDLLEGQKVNGKEEVLAEYTVVPKMMMTVEEQTTISQIQPQIANIVNSYTMQWILDGNADTTWDQYKADLEAAGLQQLIDTFQGAYDRFTSDMK